MKAISRAITITLGAGILSAVFVSTAAAGCGDLSSLQGPFVFPKAAPLAIGSTALSAKAETAFSRGGDPGASIVGLWSVRFLSQGNTSHTPPIPDGAVLDWGFNQWHSDGTELINSGGHAANTGNFCMGVWGQTGFLTFEVNHYALSYDATSGSLVNIVNIQEQVTLSPSGNSYTGTFRFDIYDPNGSKVDHVVGTITGTRVTVDPNTAFTTAP